MEFSELIAMKKSKKVPSEGEIFVLQPLPNQFYYGKVIQTNINSRDSFINGMTLIYIYNKVSQDRHVPQNLDNEELLIAPIIVNNQPWQKGYFETIGNINVSENEKKINYGFWDLFKEKFVDIKGDILENEPQYWTQYGLGSYGIVGKEVQKAIKNSY